MFYGFAIALLRALLFFIYPMKVIGREKIVYGKGVVLAANHQCFMDAVFVALAYKKQLNFLAKKELFKYKPFAALFYALGAFPVDRGAADLKAVKKALSVLKENKPLLMFPEGPRVRAGETADAKHGVAMFSVKSKVPVQPIAIVSNFKPFCRTYVVFGDPVEFEAYYGQKLDNEVLAVVSDDVIDKIRKIAEDTKIGLAKR